MTEKGGTISQDLAQVLRAAEVEFDQLLKSRTEAGAQEYGQFAFLERKTLDEAIEEVADLINWARFTGIKLIVLRDTIRQIQAQAVSDGPDGFVPTSKLYGHG